MQLPSITFAYLALLALIHSALAITVVALRFRYRVAFGDGGHETLARAIRAHGNLSEYLPLAILLIGALEVLGVAAPAIHGSLATLVIARLAHAAAMFSRDLTSPRYFVTRIFGAGATWLIMTLAAVLLLLQVG